MLMLFSNVIVIITTARVSSIRDFFFILDAWTAISMVASRVRLTVVMMLPALMSMLSPFWIVYIIIIIIIYIIVFTIDWLIMVIVISII